MKLPLKCEVKRHSENINGICMKPNCRFSDYRMCCNQCVVDHHWDHKNDVIDLADLNNK